MNFSSDYVAYLRIAVRKTTLRHKIWPLRIDITFDGRLQKQTAKMNPASWIARLFGVRRLLLVYRV
jgi:hypothetical protein